MYELTLKFGLSENKNIELQSDIFKSLIDFPITDKKEFIKDTNIALKAFSREDMVHSIYKEGEIYYILLGEAYIARESSRKKNVFLSAKDVKDIIDKDPSGSTNIKGNYLFAVLNQILKECIVYTANQMINSYYYSITPDYLVISTNLADIVKMLPGYKLNIASIIEQQLLYFPFGDKTMLDNVYKFTAGFIYKISKEKVDKKRLFDYRNLYFLDKYDQEESIDVFVNKFGDIVEDLVSDGDKFNVALTAGFDSRSIFSVLRNKNQLDIQTYAFGQRNSPNVTIPQNIAKTLGFKFAPISLDEEFQNSIERWVTQSALLSDGYYAERANYPYAYSKLSEHSPISLNGNWGSEAIRPFQNFGSLITYDFFRILNSEDPFAEFDKVYDEFCDSTYLRKDLAEGARAEVKNNFCVMYEFYKGIDKNKIIHMYSFFENEHKYFGNEIQTERLYCTNRYPYHDDEIIKILFKSPFSGVNKAAFKKDYQTIFESQYIYYKILEKYDKALLPFQTDHGYSPEAFKNIFSRAGIVLGYLKKMYKKKVIKYKEYNIDKLARDYYRPNIENMLKSNPVSDLISQKFMEDINNPIHKETPFRLHNIASMIIWFNKNGISG